MRASIAEQLAEFGFHVFRNKPLGKSPLRDGWQQEATRDREAIKRLWAEVPQANIGIFTSKFRDNEALLVVDVDNKEGKHGDQELLRLELEGKELPETFTVLTPNGGRHLYYSVSVPVKQGTCVLGEGLDVRSAGGQVVGPGSVLATGAYRGKRTPVAAAPTWLIEACGRPNEKAPLAGQTLPGVNPETAEARAVHYLKEECPAALQGERNAMGYAAACRVKDFGVSEARCFSLLLEHWRCEPMLDEPELSQVVRSAYKYGNEPVGVDAPEAQFQKVEEGTPSTLSPPPLHPFQALNREYAFVVAGGGCHVLQETTDHRGLPSVEHLNIETFKYKLAAKTILFGDKPRPLTEMWLKSSERRSYDGICFMPEQKAPERFYNLWRGFAVEPAEKKASCPAVDAFLEHALQNVCRGDEKLCRWLIGYFAHLVQRPWEKPLVALVFRGSKGVGKNALVDCVGSLLGSHYLLTSNRRFLVGNFNGHMESLLLFALDEAFWSGDKQAEGTLKDLITGKTHVIERKGQESYSVENRTRVCIIGNEEWLVPASQDERRFAVFDVGDGRKQDRHFFQSMREGMEQGGYRHLLRYLLDFNLSGIEVNNAPKTAALLEQKEHSLDPFKQWWRSCLSEGAIVGSDFGGDWPDEADKERVRNAFSRYIRERQIRSRIPDHREIGRRLHELCPSVTSGKKQEGGIRVNTYKLPLLSQARREYEGFIGHTVSWDLH